MIILTKKQAIQEGYTLCGYSNGDRFQILKNIENVDEHDFNKGEIFLADKKWDSPTIDAETIKEMIADNMESDWGNDTGDDTEEVYNTINDLDFTKTAEMINAALASIKNYKLTDIKLIK